MKVQQAFAKETWRIQATNIKKQII